MLKNVKQFIKKKRPLKRRSEMHFLLNRLKLNGKGVELGVQNGFFSRHLLSNTKLKILFSVDPWLEFKENEYLDVANVSQEQQDYRYLKTIINLSDFKNRSVVLRMISQDACELFSNKSLDFVYIDALHTYEGCRDDIALWWPKIRARGVLAGHDYVNGDLPAGRFGVKKAVDEFASRENLKLGVTKEEWPTWHVIKD